MVARRTPGKCPVGQGHEAYRQSRGVAAGDASHSGLHIFASGTIWLGVASLITFFVAYLLVLSWADYSYVQPASSFSYAVVALLGYFLLGESITPLRWVGIAVICMGVFVVGRTSPRSSPSPF